MASTAKADNVEQLGVHLVGSIRLPFEPDDPLAEPPSSASVFKTMSSALPGRLRQIPDGETGKRHFFVGWQIEALRPSPWIMHDANRDPSAVIPDNAADLDIKLGPTRYDEFAINSYKEFAELQKQGVIEPDVLFQVCIPSPVNTVSVYVKAEYQAKVEPIYEALLCSAIRNIQAHIPASKLAIQIDCAVDFAMLEGVWGHGDIFKPWFEPSLENIVGRIEGVALAVNSDVRLGFHLCYGDMAHAHFTEPKDTANLVDVANLLSQRLPHPIDFLHLPVPKERDDDAYFVPLKQLRLPAQTDVYLGLVHAHDLEGTERRMATARKFIPRFGVGTECGFGRTTPHDVSSILEISKAVVGPI